MNVRTLATLVLLALAAAGRAQSVAAGEYDLALGGASFDPIYEKPDLPAEWTGPSGEARDFFLVQFQGPTQRRWLRALEKQGWDIVQYIAPYAYVTWGETERAGLLAQSPGVRWAGAFEPAYRTLPQWRELGPQEIDIHLLLYRAVSVSAALQHLADLGARDVAMRPIDDRFVALGAKIAGERLREIARLPGVYTVQPVPTDGGDRGEMSNQLSAGNFGPGSLAITGYMGWLDGLGLHGAGVVAANVDSGVDQSHTDLAARVLPCTGVSCGGDRQSSHGTHTAGIMAGDGSSGVVDARGFLRGLGMAPGVRLVEQFYPNIFTQPGGMLTLMADSARNGALVSGNSWGPAGIPRGYDIDTMQVDIGVRDADPDAPGHQQLTYVLSIMNGWGGVSTQGTPDEAKNLIAVGATNMQNLSGAQRPTYNSIANVSAHGPALDGRSLPHLVAPGCYVDSTGLDDGHFTDCGTSMASPHVSGAAALFIEYYRRATGVAPSPALVKAAFLPTAIDLFGNTDADGVPLGHRIDSRQGWGRLDLASIVDPEVPVLYFDQETLLRHTGDEWAVHLASADPSRPVKMALVWTDAPGHGLGGATPAWNNDLDLTVEFSNGVYRGNWFGSNGWSVPGGGRDHRNNAEGVLLGPVAIGELTVRVAAANLNSDGVPGLGNDTDQDFALVCYNCETAPSFRLTAANVARTICAGEPAEFSLALEPILNFQGAASLSVSGLPAGVSAAFSLNPAPLPSQSLLTISGTDGLSAGEHWFQVEAAIGGQSRTALLALHVSEALSAAPAPNGPAHLAVDQPLAPAFSWQSLPEADDYVFELARDPQFSDIVLAETSTQTNLNPILTLRPDEDYFWRVGGRNACGDGPFSSAHRFTTVAAPTILLVDDDDNQPDARSFYTDALDAMGVAYTVWDTADSAAEPAAADLAAYTPVIWFSGAAHDAVQPKSGPSPVGEAALEGYLAGGGSLAISAQDYFSDIVGKGPAQPSAFMSARLGVDAVDPEAGIAMVTGAGPFFEGLGPFALSYPFADRSDALAPAAGAGAPFGSGQGAAASAVVENGRGAVLFGFPLEALSQPEREDALWALLGLLGHPAERPCRGPGDLQTRLADWPVARTVLDLAFCLDQYQP